MKTFKLNSLFITVLFFCGFNSFANDDKICQRALNPIAHQLQVRKSRTPSLVTLEGDALEALRSEIVMGAAVMQNDVMLMAWKPNSFGFLSEDNKTPYLEIFKQKIKAGWDINERDGNGRTALMHAGASHYNYMMSALLKLGANVDLKDKDGRTAADLSLATQLHSGLQTNLWYIEKYFTLNGLYIADAVWDNFKARDFKTLDRLFKRGVYVDTFDLALGKSLLTYAVEKNDLEMAQFLLSHGANPNFSNRDGNNGDQYPVMMASANFNQEAIELLIAHGANINGKGHYSYELNTVRQALWNASFEANPLQSNLDMVEWLLKKGANPDANLTPENLKNQKSFADFIAEILDHTRDNKGRRVAIIKVLKKHGYY